MSIMRANWILKTVAVLQVFIIFYVVYLLLYNTVSPDGANDKSTVKQYLNNRPLLKNIEQVTRIPWFHLYLNGLNELAVIERKNIFILDRAHYRTHFKQVFMPGAWKSGTEIQWMCQIANETRPFAYHLVFKPQRQFEIWTQYMFICPLDALALNASEIVVKDKEQTVEVKLKIIYPPKTQQNKVKFAVCVAPMFGDKPKVNELLQFIEVNRQFGAELFIFHYCSLTNSQRRLLQTYVNDHIVILSKWCLPKIIDKKIFYQAQLIVANDCIYSLDQVAEYVAMIDVDEAIVPRGDTTSWSDLVKVNASLSDSWSIRNTIFRKEWPSSPSQYSMIIYGEIIALSHWYREDFIYIHQRQSKLIVHPSRVFIAHVHIVLHNVNCTSYQTAQLEPNQVLLHHYRANYSDTTPKFTSVIDKSIYDTSLEPFAEAIYTRIVQRLKLIINKN